MNDEIEQLAQAYADKELIAYESFLRKASMFQHPFILKGSFATKQFFENALVRYPNDIDWLYPLPLKNIAEAKTIFTDWIKEVISKNTNALCTNRCKGFYIYGNYTCCIWCSFLCFATTRRGCLLVNSSFCRQKG